MIFAFILATALYWPGLHGPFFLDDLQSISPTQLDSFSWRKFIEISLQNDTGPIGRPISVASFALNYLFFGASPFSFKAVNLGLHFVISLAISLFIYLLVSLQPRARKQAIPIALMTGLIWLVHPLQVSTVLYPVQRMTQLCHLFILMGLNTYLWGRIRLNTQHSYAYQLIGASLFIFFPLAVLSKETGILFPWYLICIEYFLLQFHCKYLKDQKRLKRAHSLMSLSLLLGAVFYYWLNLDKFLNTFAEKNISLFDRLLTEAKVIILYMKLIFLPQLSEMGLYHDDFPISSHIDANVFISFLLLIFCAILIIFLRKRAPIVAFGLSWFFLSHTIESTALPLELVFEHRNYLAMVGLILIPVYYLVLFLSKKSNLKKTSIFLFSSIVILIMALTYFRSVSWSSPQKFLISERLNHPQSARVHIEIANWFLNNKQYDNAFTELDRAQLIEPYNGGIILHKILIHCRASSVPSVLYDEALKTVRQGAITPYVILVLDQMVQNMFNHQCSSVDKDKMTIIIQEAMKNPFLGYKPLYKAVLFHLEAGIALLQNHVDRSLLLLNESFETYPRRLDPLIQKAYLEIQFSMIEQAEKTVHQVNTQAKYLRSPSEKITTLNKTFDAVKAKENNL